MLNYDVHTNKSSYLPPQHHPSAPFVLPSSLPNTNHNQRYTGQHDAPRNGYSHTSQPHAHAHHFDHNSPARMKYNPPTAYRGDMNNYHMSSPNTPTYHSRGNLANNRNNHPRSMQPVADTRNVMDSPSRFNVLPNHNHYIASNGSANDSGSYAPYLHKQPMNNNQYHVNNINSNHSNSAPPSPGVLCSANHHINSPHRKNHPAQHNKSHNKQHNQRRKNEKSTSRNQPNAGKMVADGSQFVDKDNNQEDSTQDENLTAAAKKRNRHRPRGCRGRGSRRNRQMQRATQRINARKNAEGGANDGDEGSSNEDALNPAVPESAKKASGNYGDVQGNTNSGEVDQENFLPGDDSYSTQSDESFLLLEKKYHIPTTLKNENKYSLCSNTNSKKGNTRSSDKDNNGREQVSKSLQNSNNDDSAVLSTSSSRNGLVSLDPTVQAYAPIFEEWNVCNRHEEIAIISSSSFDDTENENKIMQKLDKPALALIPHNNKRAECRDDDSSREYSTSGSAISQKNELVKYNANKNSNRKEVEMGKDNAMSVLPPPPPIPLTTDTTAETRRASATSNMSSSTKRTSFDLSITTNVVSTENEIGTVNPLYHLGTFDENYNPLKSSKQPSRILPEMCVNEEESSYANEIERRNHEQASYAALYTERNARDISASEHTSSFLIPSPFKKRTGGHRRTQSEIKRPTPTKASGQDQTRKHGFPGGSLFQISPRSFLGLPGGRKHKKQKSFDAANTNENFAVVQEEEEEELAPVPIKPWQNW